MSSTSGQSMNYLEASSPHSASGSMRSCNSTSSLCASSLSGDCEQVYFNSAYDYGDSSGVSSCSSHDYEDLQSVRVEAKSISCPRKKANELYESSGNSSPRKKTNVVYEPSGRPHRERQITECSDISTASSAFSDALPSKNDTCLSKLIIFLILALSVAALILVGLLISGKVGPKCGCTQEGNLPVPRTGMSVSVQSLLERIKVLERDMLAMKNKTAASDNVVKEFFTIHENKMEFLQTQISRHNMVINETTGKVESLQARISTQGRIFNESMEKVESLVDGAWVNMTSSDKALEKKLAAGLKILKTSVKALNRSDSELTSDMRELREDQIRTRGMSNRLGVNVTLLELRVQKLKRSSRNISSRALRLEQGYAQMNTLMKRIQAINGAQNISQTALETLFKRLNASLINVNLTLYNKVSASSGAKAAVDFRTCQHRRINGTSVSLGSTQLTQQAASSSAEHKETQNNRVMGVTCSTDYAKEYKLRAPRKGLYTCDCYGFFAPYVKTRTTPKTMTCFLHVWECTIS